MKKNKMMRLASALLVAVLLTTSVISGTYAKYVTKTTGSDSARVAFWGFNKDAVTALDLFDGDYVDVVSNDETNVIAPGTEKTAGFSILNASTTAPEVDYTFVVSTAGSTCDQDIQNNANIKWYLDGSEAGTDGTWEELLEDLEALDGDKTYKAGEFPTEFVAGKTHTVGWKWLFDATVDGANDLDDTDTAMGNKETLDRVEIVITVTATQVNN